MANSRRSSDFMLGKVAVSDVTLAAGNNNIGTVRAETPAAIVYGQQAVAEAGTAEALVGSATPLVQGLTVTADGDNTGLVFLGDEDVDSANGYKLAAGQSVFIAVTDAAAVYVDAANNDDAVSFIGG